MRRLLVPLLCLLALSVPGRAQTVIPVVSGFLSPDHIEAFHPVTVTITNGSGATVTGYTGEVSFSSTDANASLPAPYTFQVSDHGSHTFPVALNTGGTQAITVTAGTSSGTLNGIVVDDYVWVVNNDGTLSKLDETGATVLASTGNPNQPASTASVGFDSLGGTWSTISSTNALLHTLASGASPVAYTSGDIFFPVSLAVDGAGDIWVANTSNSLSVFANSGAVISYPMPYQITSGTRPSALDSPSSLAIDRSGSLWIANAGNGSITKLIGAATPVITPTSSAVSTHSLGNRP